MTNLSDGLQALAALADDEQHHRILVLDFPQGDGPAAKMRAQRLDAYEGLSRDFMFTVEVLADDARIPLKDVQGKNVTISLVRPDGTMRYFNGYVFEFRLVSTNGTLAFYNMVLLPWTAYLRLQHDNYLFHGKTMEQQTGAIFGDYEVADWQFKVTGEDPVMTDACQFDETDYNYLHRRWEALGWHYHYEHRFDGHTLVLNDDTLQASAIDGSPAIPWQSEGGSHEEDGVRDWTPVRRIVPSRVTLSGFDFKKPKPATTEVPTINRQGDVLNRETYEYTGAYGFKDLAHADRLARQRMEEIEASGKHFEGISNNRFIQPGRWFTLSGHFDAHPQNGAPSDGSEADFLVTECRHEVLNNYLQATGMPAYFENKFSCLRKTIPWRPGRAYNSIEPRVQGLQTAIVVGPPGSEIHTDEYGRVKVQFHWDRVGTYDDKSSAWIRVVSAWTGKGYGFVGIPRVGQEVVVQFLDGNPDRPLITGCVYNQDNMPPFGLPGGSHKTGIQTRSTPGAGGLCEMVIHDAAGQELINIFSQKDMVRTVLNNDSTVVKGPQQTIAVTTGTQATTVHGSVSTVSETNAIQQVAHTAYEVTAQTQHIKLTAATDIELTVGASKLRMTQDGTIQLEGVNVTIIGSGRVDINP